MTLNDDINYDYITLVMQVLNELNLPLKRSAVVVMLEDGILTQETKFQYYLAAKNVYDALVYHVSMQDKIHYILGRGLEDELKQKVWDVWDNKIAKSIVD